MKQEFPFLIILSVISLTVGAASLRLGSLVTLSLTYLTIVAILILLIYAIYLILTDSRKFTFIGVILALISFAVSTNSAHFEGLSNIFSSPYIYLTIADITMILGFYLFPSIYIVLWIYRYYAKRGPAVPDN